MIIEILSEECRIGFTHSRCGDMVCDCRCHRGLTPVPPGRLICGPCGRDDFLAPRDLVTHIAQCPAKVSA